MDEIIDKYADMVYRIAFTQMKNKSDADDVFQEVFLRLCRSMAKIQGDKHLKAWLIRVTVNVCKSALASSWRKNVVELTEDLSYQLPENADDMISAVKSISPKYSVVIHLFYFESMSVKEISNALKIKETTIKSQLSRGRNLLKEKLKGDFDYV